VSILSGEDHYKIAEVTERLGVSYKSMHDWIARYSKPEVSRKAEDSALPEIQQLKAELKRVTEERDILKEAAVHFAGESKKSTRS